MSCRCTGYSVRDTIGQTVTSVVGDDTGGSPFESALRALGPVVFNRFRDANFTSNIEDNSGNGNHLVKQNAAATRSSIPIRTTHPGGALFPAVTYDNWASQGTPYEGPTGLLSGEAAATLIFSGRVIADESSGANSRLFGVAEPDADEGSTNDVFTLMAGDGTGEGEGKHTTSTGAIGAIQTDVTERIDDGVNRLFILTYEDDDTFTLTTYKPGYYGLQESSSAATSGTGLTSASRTLLMNGRLNTSTGSNETSEFVCDASALFDYKLSAAQIADIGSKWAAEVVGAGYYPSMMQYDGSTGYYNKEYTSAGNKVTTFARFSNDGFAGSSTQDLCQIIGPTSTYSRARLLCWGDDADAELAGRIGMLVNNSASTTICLVISESVVCDGDEHTIFAAFDGDNGTALLVIDGVVEDDTGNSFRTAPTTGTLDSGASSDMFVGALNATPQRQWDGTIGLFGHREAYLTNHTDFPTDPDALFAIDEKNWAEWGAQPLFWSHTGQLSNNKGSAGDMTENGSIVMTEGGSP